VLKWVAFFWISISGAIALVDIHAAVSTLDGFGVALLACGVAVQIVLVGLLVFRARAVWEGVVTVVHRVGGRRDRAVCWQWPALFFLVVGWYLLLNHVLTNKMLW
jgi:hypothetical protein